LFIAPQKTKAETKKKKKREPSELISDGDCGMKSDWLDPNTPQKRKTRFSLDDCEILYEDALFLIECPYNPLLGLVGFCLPHNSSYQLCKVFLSRIRRESNFRL